MIHRFIISRLIHRPHTNSHMYTYLIHTHSKISYSHEYNIGDRSTEKQVYIECCAVLTNDEWMAMFIYPLCFIRFYFIFFRVQTLTQHITNRTHMYTQTHPYQCTETNPLYTTSLDIISCVTHTLDHTTTTAKDIETSP